MSKRRGWKSGRFDFSDIFPTKSDENDAEENIGFWDDDDDDIPEGCAACGGDWPRCTSSCPLYDD